MKCKVIHIDKLGNETIVATVRTFIEASNFRDLLQAKCNDQDNSYYQVEYKQKGATKRSGADSFYKMLPYFNVDVKKSIHNFLDVKI